MDQLDACRPRLLDAAGPHVAAGDAERSAVRRDDAGGDAGEGGLAGAVLPDHGMDHPDAEGNAHAGEGRDVAVVNGDVAAFEGGRRHRKADQSVVLNSTLSAPDMISARAFSTSGQTCFALATRSLGPCSTQTGDSRKSITPVPRPV